MMPKPDSHVFVGTQAAMVEEPTGDVVPEGQDSIPKDRKALIDPTGQKDPAGQVRQAAVVALPVFALNLPALQTKAGTHAAAVVDPGGDV